MNDTVEYFLHTNPAFPWNLDRVGLPLLAAVAGLLIALTVWTYKGHPRATRSRPGSTGTPGSCAGSIRPSRS